MTERELQPEILLAASKDGHRLFRNAVGVGYVGIPVHLPNGELLLKRWRAVRFGLGAGSSDLIGWTSTGLFLAVENKHRGAATAAQLSFISAVQAAGGRAGIARNVNDAREIWGSDVNAR